MGTDMWVDKTPKHSGGSISGDTGRIHSGLQIRDSMGPCSKSSENAPVQTRQADRALYLCHGPVAPLLKRGTIVGPVGDSALAT